MKASWQRIVETTLLNRSHNTGIEWTEASVAKATKEIIDLCGAAWKLNKTDHAKLDLLEHVIRKWEERYSYRYRLHKPAA